MFLESIHEEPLHEDPEPPLHEEPDESDASSSHPCMPDLVEGSPFLSDNVAWVHEVIRSQRIRESRLQIHDPLSFRTRERMHEPIPECLRNYPLLQPLFSEVQEAVDEKAPEGEQDQLNALT